MNKKKRSNQQGAVTLIYISLISMIAVLLLTASYSRLLLSLRTNTSLSDTILATYKAESEINDILAKFIGAYIRPEQFPFSNESTIQGTNLKVVGVQNGNVQKVTVTAKRSFASTTLEASRTLASTSGSGIVEIILALDCTQSMDDHIPQDSQYSLFDRLEQAATGFIDLAANTQQQRAGSLRIGSVAFATTAKWITPPTTDMARVRADIANGFGNEWSNSPVCKTGIVPGTSIGSGFAFINQYFADQTASNTKRIIVSMSDGRITTSALDTRCPVTSYCPFDIYDCQNPPAGMQCARNSSGGFIYGEGKCRNPGLNLLRCSLTPRAQGGIRDAAVDTYMVTVYPEPSGSAAEERIFQNNDGSGIKYMNQYFNASSGDDLGPIFANLFSVISSNSGIITIRRILPQ